VVAVPRGGQEQNGVPSSGPSWADERVRRSMINDEIAAQKAVAAAFPVGTVVRREGTHVNAALRRAA